MQFSATRLSRGSNLSIRRGIPRHIGGEDRRDGGLVHAASPAAAAARSLAAMTNVTRPRMMAAAEPARFAIPMLCIVASFLSLLDVVASLCPFQKPGTTEDDDADKARYAPRA